MKKRKRILVLFSGGLDSTFLIYKNLKEGNEVYPLYVEIINNEAKTSIEKQQIKKLYDRFIEKDEFSRNLHRIEYGYRAEVVGSPGDGLLFVQLPIWLSGILYFSNLHTIDEVQVGYVMNDDIISYTDDIKKIYNSFAPLFEKKLPKLVFSLSKYKKEHIINELSNEYLELTYSCEAPRITENNSSSNDVFAVKVSKKLKFSKSTANIKDIQYTLCGTCAPCARRKKLNINSDKYHIEPENKLIDSVCSVDAVKFNSYPGKQLSFSDISDDFEKIEDEKIPKYEKNIGIFA